MPARSLTQAVTHHFNCRRVGGLRTVEREDVGQWWPSCLASGLVHLPRADSNSSTISRGNSARAWSALGGF